MKNCNPCAHTALLARICNPCVLVRTDYISVRARRLKNAIFHRTLPMTMLIVAMTIIMACSSPGDRIDLSGQWQVALDSLDTGIAEKWFDRSFNDGITLPGTLCDAGYGKPCSLRPAMEAEILLNLKPKYEYVGVAWYSREVEIPAGWQNKQVLLHLERVIWNSQVWIDGQQTGQTNESLSTPHGFDLTRLLTPGKHRITLRIDNRKQHDITYLREKDIIPRYLAHAYTNDTQTMWNGVIGELTLTAVEGAYIKNIVLTPDVDASKVRVRLTLAGVSDDRPGKIVFSVKERNGAALPEMERVVTGNDCSFDYVIDHPKLWDEFNPQLYETVVTLKTDHTIDRKKATFGMCKLSAQQSTLHLNDRRIFLRGTLECCIFPLKGYPPMEKAAWRKLYGVARDYGLNHIRFHSWCPPEAAFEVADEMGMYLQVELPLWVHTVGDDPKTVTFLYDEAGRIMHTYGNHPSFCFFCLGNELGGDFEVLDSILMSLKTQDDRRLYSTTTTFGSNRTAWPETHDDFWVTHQTRKGVVRGQRIYDTQPVSFQYDYRASIDSIPVPVISHEIGQYSVFPNLNETGKYTGNLLPLNFMAVRDDLDKKGRLAEADIYTQASGKLAAILYKEEIERALKTPGFSGFQLLDLHDFPGQGTALVGLLDAFWESKGIITPEAFRYFCAPVVPLARFAKATYTNDETLTVAAEVANFSDRTLTGILPEWKLVDSKGQTVARGSLPRQDIIIGNALPLGEFSIMLAGLRQAEKLTLSLSFQDMEVCNTWDIWVYPAKLETVASDVVVTRDAEEARQLLQQGGKVLLNIPKEKTQGLEGMFVPVFWSPVFFPNQPGTMGIICDPSHPALRDFPTESHSNWQWWDICKSGKTLVLDSLDFIQPIVGVVDNFFKNRKLGLIFEAKVGNGMLLVCSPDLYNDLENRPVARQLRYSLMRYMSSSDFNPKKSITFKQLENNFLQSVSL